MSINPESRDLLTTALLNLDPRINDKRLALYSILVEVSLYNLKKASDLEEIKAEINRIINQNSFLSESDLKHSIVDCLSRKTIQPIGESYELSQKRKELFIKVYSEAENCRSLVEKELEQQIEEEIGDELDNDIKKRVIDAVERTLTKNIYENSINLSRENLTFEQLVENIESSEPAELIKKTLDDIIPEERVLLKHKIVGGINAFFKKMPKELKSFLQLLNSNVLLNQILIIDPSIAQKQLDWFSHRRLYLDTNVVISFFFEAQKCHLITTEVINASKRIGVQLFISPATLIELGKQVDRAKKNYIAVEKQKILRAIAIQGDDAILATFFLIKRRQPSIEWVGFITQFENIEEFLLQNDVIVENEGMTDAKTNPILPVIQKAISDSKPPYTKPNVIDHDAINCSLILSQRNKYLPDERGQILWLLTLDNSLKQAQRLLKKSQTIDIPYSMQVSDWGEIVLPIQSLLGLEFNDFIGYLAQAKLGAISDPEIIQLDFVETITDSTLDIDRLQNLEPNQICNVLKKLQLDYEAKSILTDLKQTTLEPKIERLKANFNNKIDQAIIDSDPIKLISEEYDKKITLLSNKIETQDKAISILKENLQVISDTWWNRLFIFLKRLFTQ